MSSLVLGSFGGDSYHMPGHSVQSVVAAYVEGVDLVRLCVQRSADGVCVLYPHADLSATTDGQGAIGQRPWSELRELDAGHQFSRGGDFPWRKWVINQDGRPHNRRHHRLTPLAAVLDVLEGAVTYALQFWGASASSQEWKSMVRGCLDALDHVGAERVILCGEDAAQLDALHEISGGKLPLGLVATAENVGSLTAPQHRPQYVFCPWNVFGPMSADARQAIGGDARWVFSVPAETDANTVSEIARVAYGIESNSALHLAPLVRGSRVRFEDDFAGTRIDREHWVAGVSSGYTNFHRAALAGIDDRGLCEAKVYQDNALVIDVAEGYQYASGAAITRFSVGGEFAAEVAFRYENPQRATEMVMCALNCTVYTQYHREGPIQHVSVNDEHPAFDAHGLCPYVSVEREEADGTRIMYNESPSELFHLRQNNIYNHDVGATDSKDVEMRMARRGRFFTGSYKDEKNPDWIGVGYVENSSLNERVFVRLSGKHYPKSGAPDPLPWNRFIIKRFCVRQPRS